MYYFILVARPLAETADVVALRKLDPCFIPDR